MNIFSVDAESDGLWGDIWAIGAVVLNDAGTEIDRFEGQVDPAMYVADKWVKEHIVPVVNLPMHANAFTLYEEFWSFWMSHRDSSLCVVDFGGIVEAHLFRSCVEQSQHARNWNGPYPMHELGTALLLAGVDPDIDRRAFAGMPDAVPHQPVDDASVSARCWMIATSMIERKPTNA